MLYASILFLLGMAFLGNLGTLISYSFLTAALTWCLLALMLQMKTRVLLSSIFFIADSVVRGCLMMLYASILFLLGIALLGNLGSLAGLKVLGLLKCTVVLTFFTLVPCVPFTTFFCTFSAFRTCLAGAPALSLDL